MIEADIKKFLNSRTPKDPLFRALDLKIDDVLSEVDSDRERAWHERRREIYRNRSTETGGYLLEHGTSSTNVDLGLAIYLANHYLNSFSTDVLRISDNMDRFAYLYTDNGSTTYTQKRIGGTYNPTVFTTANRAGMVFSDVLPNISWTNLEMSNDGDIIFVTSAVQNNYLYIFKRDEESLNKYTIVELDQQPTAGIVDGTANAAYPAPTAISGDGRKIFCLSLQAPYLHVYYANEDRTKYIRQDIEEIGLPATQYVGWVCVSVDGNTVALGYNSSSTGAGAKTFEVFKILPGDDKYTQVNVPGRPAATIGGNILPNFKRAMQLSRDGNRLILWMYTQNQAIYYPYILDYNEETRLFAFDPAFHANQLWRLSSTYQYGVFSSSTNYLPQTVLSPDGKWLFMTIYTRTTGSGGGVSWSLLASDISNGQVGLFRTIQTNQIMTGAPADGMFADVTFNWIDPKMRFILRGLSPNRTAVTGTNQYVYNQTGNRSVSVVAIDPDFYWNLPT